MPELLYGGFGSRLKRVEGIHQRLVMHYDPFAEVVCFQNGPHLFVSGDFLAQCGYDTPP